ncbi:MAG: efflux RND transporter periplasmic adaptor subunit [Planctomycetota bacterium]
MLNSHRLRETVHGCLCKVAGTLRVPQVFTESLSFWRTAHGVCLLNRVPIPAQKEAFGFWRTAHGVCLLLFLLMLSLGCHRRSPEAPLPVAVQVATLKREDIASQSRFTATVREQQRIELSFKVPGTVLSLLQVSGLDGKPRDVHEGDEVVADPAGPLASLDGSDYQRRLEMTRDRLAQAQARQRATEATVTAVRANFDRMKALRQRESVTQQAFEDVQARRDSADAELDGSRREVSAATTALQQAEDDRKNCALSLPITKATVSRKYVENGERVQAGQPVFQVMDLATLRVAFGVPDTKVNQFSPGQTMTVLADAYPGERFVGRVSKILPAADLRTRSFEVEVTIEHPRGLRPGMIVTLITGRQESLILLPMTAIGRGETPAEMTVFVIFEEDGRKVARRCRVELGGVYDNRIRLIETGSKVIEGQMIVVTGAFRLTEGQEVRPLESQEPTLRIGM